jgi:hypothetical protein
MEAGRPAVLDEVKRREICAILAVGCNRETAARYVGCHRTTIQRTAARDEAFAEALLHAESTHEILHLTNINKAAKEVRYWRAAAWALERKYPGRYGVRDPSMLSMEQVSQILSQFADLILEEVPTPADRERILSRLTDLTAGLQAANDKENEA